LSERCRGLIVAIDVQHLYRPNHPRDRGTVFRLADGTTVTEAALATQYAQAAAEYLTARGALVLVNQPAIGELVGFYSARNRFARVHGAHAYLACHVNAGRGSYAALEHLDGVTVAARLASWIGSALSGFPSILNARNLALRHGERGAVCIEACGPAMAALVVEPFFGDNPKQQQLTSAAQLVAVGQVIGQGVASWWGAGHGSP
jgi:N-acetylmuramoyl-L-alanine amidase